MSLLYPAQGWRREQQAHGGWSGDHEPMELGQAYKTMGG